MLEIRFQKMRIPRFKSATAGLHNTGSVLRRPPSRAHPTSAHGATVLYSLPSRRMRDYPLQLHPFDGPYLERLRAGDFRTQEHFVAYFSELIQIKLRSRLRSKEAIEDVRQETFTRVLVALREGRIVHPERLGSFVNSTCKYALLEHYRADSHDHCLDDHEDKDCADESADLFATFSAKQTGEKVRRVLDQLSERDRRLLREVFLEERDKDDVCRDFGVDRDYLRVLVHRAKQAFKSLYFKDMEENSAAAPA